MHAGRATGGFGRRGEGGPYDGGGVGWGPAAGGGGSGGFGAGTDPNASKEVRSESGVLRFVGVFLLVMTVVGLGGGFTVRAEERDLREAGRDGIWREDNEAERAP